MIIPRVGVTYVGFDKRHPNGFEGTCVVLLPALHMVKLEAADGRWEVFRVRELRHKGKNK